MKLLIFGKTGQVARELARRCPDHVEAVFLDRGAVDLSNPQACAAAIRDADAQVVMNAAAWTAVDKAETDEAAATVVNGASPTAMAVASAEKGVPFLHISTDYVFDGAGTVPFEPSHITGPLGAYGRSKHAGEVGVMQSGAHALVLRTSWVVSSHGSNFVKTMLRLGAERERLSVVDDQIGGPTPAAAIADTLYVCAGAMMDGQQGGIYHFAGAPAVSWAAFAREIMAQAGLPCEIVGIPSADYPTPAARPANSRLDCTGLKHDFDVSPADWKADLKDILSDLGVLA